MIDNQKFENLKIYTIAIDGIDKAGKDLVRTYVYYLGGARYICNARGIMSMCVYADMNNRGYAYDADQQIHVLNVLLEVDKEDWEIRCKNTNEKMIDYDTHTAEFRKCYESLKNGGLPTATFNTSRMTPYDIAKEIVSIMHKLNHPEG